MHEYVRLIFPIDACSKEGEVVLKEQYSLSSTCMGMTDWLPVVFAVKKTKSLACSKRHAENSTPLHCVYMLKTVLPCIASMCMSITAWFSFVFAAKKARSRAAKDTLRTPPTADKCAQTHSNHGMPYIIDRSCNHPPAFSVQYLHHPSCLVHVIVPISNKLQWQERNNN